MNIKWQTIALSIFIMTLSACSDNASSQKPAAEKEHFLTEKLETIKKAEQVEQMVLDAAKTQRRNIEENGG